jgi:hypothetical protein
MKFHVISAFFLVVAVAVTNVAVFFSIFICREAGNSHKCHTSLLESSSITTEDEFHAQFENYQLWMDIYANLTQHEVTLVVQNNTIVDDTFFFTLKSPQGIFDCQEIDKDVPLNKTTQHKLKCLAYGYFEFWGADYRFLFVHADTFTVEYRQTNRIQITLETAFNSFFDLMISTEKACSKFHKHFVFSNATTQEQCDDDLLVAKQ